MQRPTPAKRRVLLALFAIALAAAVVHLPGIGRPFGHHEINAGNYCGVFARNLERLGWWTVRGAPLGPTLIDGPHDPQVIPYMSHPPGVFWLMWIWGTSEASLRLLTALGHLLAAALLGGLVHRRLGLLPATVAALSFVAFPALAFYSQVSYENLVLPVGLLLLLCQQRLSAGGRHPGWRTTQALAALVGPWLDWQFGFFCLALPLLGWPLQRRGVASDSLRMLRAMLTPAACSLASVAGMLAWRSWAQGLWPTGNASGVGLDQLLLRTVATRPETASWLSELLARLQEGFSSPVLMIAAVGLLPLALLAPRLTGALGVVAILNPLVFPAHSMAHTLYLAYAAPLLAAAIGAIGALARRNPAVALLLLGLVAATAGRDTWSLQRETATTFYRDLGAELTAAVDAGDGRRAVVAFNLPFCYGYYVGSPLVVITPLDAAFIQTHQQRVVPTFGLRYLWFRSESAPGTPQVARGGEDLARYLAPFPRTRIPSLERTLHVPPAGHEFRITEAWLVTIAP